MSCRSIRLLVEEGLNHLPVVEKTVETPTGANYDGVGFCGKIAGVSSGSARAGFKQAAGHEQADRTALLCHQVMRAGEAMEAGLRECCRSVKAKCETCLLTVLWLMHDTCLDPFALARY